MSDWFITDNDCLQCCRPVPEADSLQYEFVQVNSYPGHVDGTPFYQVAHGQVDLRDYSTAEIQDIMAFYGCDERPEDRILAEMFFETEIQEYVVDEHPSWNEAAEHIGQITGLDIQEYLEKEKSDLSLKKIRVYDLDALFKEADMEPFRYNKVAVFEGTKGVIVSEHEAVHFIENRTSDSIVIPANHLHEPGRIWLIPEYEATLSIDEIMTAPYTEMTMEEFFDRRNYNPRCMSNYSNLMSHLNQIGFDLHGYFPQQQASLSDKIASASHRRSSDPSSISNQDPEIHPER